MAVPAAAFTSWQGLAGRADAGSHTAATPRTSEWEGRWREKERAAGEMERKRGRSEREKRGEGEESEEFDMLCA